MTVFSVRHLTTYRYKRPVQFGEHRMFFRPRDSYDQRLLRSEVVVGPAPSVIRWKHDVFGNCLATISCTGPATELRFEACIRIDHRQHQGPDLSGLVANQTFPFLYGGDEADDLNAFIRVHYPSNEISDWAKRFVAPGMAGQATIGSPWGEALDIHGTLETICHEIYGSFAYARRSAHGTQSPQTTLELRRGTCRDFALLMMEVARSLGLAARFVTGYIYVPSRDGSGTLGGGSTHAWCEVYVPGAGWAEFDPTNGIIGNRDLIRVAVARDPRQVIPLSGTYDGTAADFDSLAVQVNVTTEIENKASNAA
jgi:transglutaminase-like putative cysteine protease